MARRKLLAYGLMASSSVFLWIHVLVLIAHLQMMTYAGTLPPGHGHLAPSPIIDIIWSDQNIVFIASTFVIGVLLLSTGAYIARRGSR